MKNHRGVLIAKGLVAFAALLPIVAVPTAGATSLPTAGAALVTTAAAALMPTDGAPSVPPFPSPATVLTLGDSSAFHGAVCQGNTCTPVYYPWFVTPLGVMALEDAITTTSADKIVVFGYSNGALSAEQWMEQHVNDPNIPSPDVLSFVVIGNPARKWPQSPYQVIDVSQQYDAASDYPNNPDSPYYALAIANAGAGFWTLHLDYRDVNINDPANAVWQDGNTTYVLTPTQNLPILMGLPSVFPFLKTLNEQLKADIETAYIRPIPFPTTTPTPPEEPPLAAASALSSTDVRGPAVNGVQSKVPARPERTAPARTIGATDSLVPGRNTAPTTPPAVDADNILGRKIGKGGIAGIRGTAGVRGIFSGGRIGARSSNRLAKQGGAGAPGSATVGGGVTGGAESTGGADGTQGDHPANPGGSPSASGE